MKLPIDASAAPYREKYLTCETPVLNRWRVQGDGPTVDIIDGTDDIFTCVPADKARRLVAAREFFCLAVEWELALRDAPTACPTKFADATEMFRWR